MICTYDYRTSKTIGGDRLLVEVSPRLESTIDEIINYIDHCYIEDKVWQHNIHKELKYDYCPFNEDGYRLKCTIKFNKRIYMDWFEYMLNTRLDVKRGLEVTLENSRDNNKEDDSNNAQ